jgi:hypothetical protein
MRNTLLKQLWGWNRTTVQVDPLTSDEPELQQYQYVRIHLQIQTLFRTYDSVQIRREWKVPLGATTPLHTVNHTFFSASDLDINQAVMLQPNNIFIKRVGKNKTFQLKYF